MYRHSPNVTAVKDAVDLGFAERVSVFERVKRIAGNSLVTEWAVTRNVCLVDTIVSRNRWK